MHLAIKDARFRNHSNEEPRGLASTRLDFLTADYLLLIGYVPSSHEFRYWVCSAVSLSIFTPSADGTARIWDASTGEELFRMAGHTSTVVSVFFSPDGRQLATTGRDGVTKLWDTNSGELLLNLFGNGDGLNGIAISPDGSKVATGGEQGLRVYLWQINDLIALAKSRLTRTWTLNECQKYLHMATCPSTPSWWEVSVPLQIVILEQN